MLEPDWGTWMEYLDNSLQERNRQIGQILREARLEKDISISTCAKLLKTSRRRYIAMEQGETIIGAAELERLAAFMDIPPHKIWNAKNPLTPPFTIQMAETPTPGESVSVQIVLAFPDEQPLNAH